MDRRYSSILHREKGENQGSGALKNGAPVFMLGVVPVFAHPVKTSVNITILGEN